MGIFSTPVGSLYDTSFLPKQEQELRKSDAHYNDKKWEAEVR